MNKLSRKVRLLRVFWGLIPWLVVASIGAFIVDKAGQIKEKKARLEEARKVAMKKEIPAVRVITLTLEPRRLKDKISLPATVEPYENLWVKAELPGQIVKVLVKKGRRVKRGQVLVELDDRDYRIRLARIEASYKLAKLEYDRYVSLAKEKITAASRLDEAEAKLTELTAQRSEAELALSRTRIIAPISGRLNELIVEYGDLLEVNQKVAQILQFGKVKVIVGVPESDVAAVFDLKEADLVIEALNKRRVKGKKIFLSRRPRSLARLYDLELIVPNPDGRILPGMFARVELVKAVFDQALAIPLYAVITRGDERFVYVEKEGRAEKRIVELGVLVGWQVQIKAGLRPGERVIVVGHRFLVDGQKVEVVKDVSRPSEIFKS